MVQLRRVRCWVGDLVNAQMRVWLELMWEIDTVGSEEMEGKLRKRKKAREKRARRESAMEVLVSWCLCVYVWRCVTMQTRFVRDCRK